MGEVGCRQILPLPQDKPEGRGTASRKTSGWCVQWEPNRKVNDKKGAKTKESMQAKKYTE